VPVVSTQAKRRGTYRRGPRVDQSGRGGRFYAWRGNMYWSVTTIINGGIPKPVLVNWAKKVTAEAAVRSLKIVNEMVESEGPDAAVDWLKRAPDRIRDKAGDVGTAIHKAAEAYTLEKPYPEWTDDERPSMERFVAWLERFQPAFLAAEVPVFSDRERYAGRLDAIIEFDRDDARLMWEVDEKRPVRLMLDYTTAKGVYPEKGLQMSAYRFADTWLGLPNGEEGPMPRTDGGAVLHIRPDGCELVPMRVDEDIFQVFLYAREIFRYAEEDADTVVGSPWGVDE
jgi:hypothetical protein